jgi:uncharacterized repeat protein (TIGR01451 family)
LRIDVPVDRPATAVSLFKTASRARAQSGDVVFYTVTASNADAARVKRGVTVVDTLPSQLRLRPGSIRVDGAAAAANTVSIAPDGRTLTVQLGTIAPDSRRSVTYATSVRSGTPPGQAVNKAAATDSRGLTAYASAVVTIDPDNLAGRMTVIGRITAGDCSTIGERLGVPGVRVILEDGSFAVTDNDGRYHFDGVVPGNHVAAVQEATLPEGQRLVNCSASTRSAGSATSRFVTGQGGSLAVADFYADLSEEQMLALPGAPRGTPGNTAEALEIPLGKPGDEPPTGTLDEAAQSSRAAAGADIDWLALSDGPPAFLFPAADHNPRAPAIRVAIRHGANQTVELVADGKPVAKVSFDGTKKSADGVAAVSLWRGVPIEGSVVHLAATVLNADGSVAGRLVRDVYFTGTAAEVRLLPEQSRLVADGQSRPVVAVRILDRTGRPVHAGLSGEFRLDAPYESAEAIDAMQSRALSGLGRASPHWSVKGDDGIALIELAPTMVSGAFQLHFTFTDGQQKRQQSLSGWIVPGEQKWTLVGLAEGSVGEKTVADAMERTGQFDSDLGDRGRVAFYAKGRVLGSTLLTVAYDSAKQRDDQQLLGAIDPRAYYTVFADGSTRRFDAASRNKLYVRIESRAFYAIFGDVEAGFNETQLTRYQRVATGVKAEARTGGLRAKVFAADVASGHQRDEIQGAGITGPYPLTNKAILGNSEQVTLTVRDRFRSEVIVSQTQMTRFIDYDVDLLAGTITFKQPILSRDFAQNPQFIVIDYEVDRNSASGALNAGGRVDFATADGTLRVGATAISDTGDGSRTGMAGLDLKAQIAPSTQLRAEAAVSRNAGNNDSAWLIEVEHHDGNLDVLAYARSMDQGYGVGQTSGVESGRRKYGADARLTLDESFSVTTSAWIDDSLTDLAHREALQVRGEYRIGRSELRLGLSTLRDHLVDGTTAKSTTIDGGVTERLLNGKLEVDASASVGLGDTDSVDLPSRQQITLRYAVTPAAKLIGTYEIANGSSVKARSGRIGFEISPWRGARASSSVGAQDVAEYGKRSFAAFGLAQSLELTQHLSVDATIDNNHVLSGVYPAKVINPEHPVTSGGQIGPNGTIAEDFTAMTLGATWRYNNWTTTLRGEWRDGEFAERKGFTFGAIRQLGQGSVVGSGFTWTRASGSDGSASEIYDGAVALAHRPANSPLALLSKVEFRSDKLVSPTATIPVGNLPDAGPTALDIVGTARSSRLIGSVSVNWSPRGYTSEDFVQRTEIGLFTALRYNLGSYQDEEFSATALLAGLDLHIGIGERIEVGGTATLRTTLSDQVTQFAIGPSVGFVPTRDVLLTLGYNITGYRDRDFAEARNTSGGAFAALKAKFDTSTLGFLGLAQ